MSGARLQSLRGSSPFPSSAAIARPRAAAMVVHLPKLCTVRETANTLRRSDKTVREYIATGRLEAIRLVQSNQARVLIPRDSIERLLARSLGDLSA
jgi:Helix-turn-helix domain